VPVDARARDAARAAGAGELAVWAAAVSGGAAPLEVHGLATGDVDVLRTTLARRDDAAVLSVGEVALAVDTGRALAAEAAARGVHVVVARASDAAASDSAARALAAALAGGAGEHGPLGALRRLGDAPIAVLCGVALGAGERGLGCVCDGPAAIAGGAVAAAIEPDLRPRLLAGGDPALARDLGLAVAGAAGAIADALRAASGPAAA
jgi:nicotinate-nucleotide--dimethylbenzimidazole phosphoribosyltransferase